MTRIRIMLSWICLFFFAASYLAYTSAYFSDNPANITAIAVKMDAPQFRALALILLVSCIALYFVKDEEARPIESEDQA
jgi:hypothetical protein